MMMRRKMLFLSLAGLVVALVVMVPSRSTPQVDGFGAPAPDTGATVTSLPDGRELIVGGEDAPGRVILRDRERGALPSLTAGLHVPRAWHSATVLPDGLVLV